MHWCVFLEVCIEFFLLMMLILFEDQDRTSAYETSSKAQSPSTTTNPPTKSWDYGAPAGQPEQTDNRINTATLVSSHFLYIVLPVCFVIRYL